MAPGTNRKKRALTMRQDRSIVWTRALRLRLFPTDYGHAALCRAIGSTCAYQSDSSSKRPGASVAFGTTTPPHRQFSTCWRWRCASKNAPHPAAGLVRGPHPTAARSARQHVENCSRAAASSENVPRWEIRRAQMRQDRRSMKRTRQPSCRTTAQEVFHEQAPER